MNLSEKSAIISCNNMRELAKNEFIYYDNKMKNIFDLCSNKYYNQENYLNEKYQGYLPSLYINNKSCIYKKPIYNQGDWVKQFDNNDITHKFNQQTRNKFNGISYSQV